MKQQYKCPACPKGILNTNSVENYNCPDCGYTMPAVSLQIEKLYAFISVAEDGFEGVCAKLCGMGLWMPLICSDEKLLPELRGVAKDLAKENGGSKIVLYEFSQKKKLEEI